MHKTIRIWRRQLPHWEVEGGWYFITLRCHGSLPMEACRQLDEIRSTLDTINPASDAFRLWQRKYHAILENALDAGTGYCPFSTPESQTLCNRHLRSTLNVFGWMADCFVIMPNHLHLLVKPNQTDLDLERFVQRLKGRTARMLNPTIRPPRKLWQREWYDHWVRDQREFDNIRTYIQNNPIKAHLTQSPENYPGLWMGPHSVK